MDVHRCRFVPYPSSAINALAFSHTASQISRRGPPNLRLAIGRANGDIEIWNPQKGAWYQESILRGGKDRSIEGLAWTQDPEDVNKRGQETPGKLRLFSIGYSTAVTEWDLALGRPLGHSGGNYGEVWCMAAQPKGPKPAKKVSEATDEASQIADPQLQNIAVGCADGAIIILATADGDLRYTKTIARSSKKKSRVLSLVFQNRHTLVAGHADSTIRIYDLRGGQPVRNMTLGTVPRGGPKETLIWSVKCLSDGTIVAGDSTGTVSFWDGKQHALSQRIKSHHADVLDIAASADGQSIFSGGMDRRTVLYRRTETGSEGAKSRWEEVTHTRLHKNDVKAMATFETKGMSVLLSGGLDTNPIVIPMQEFGREHHRTLSNLPQQPSLLSVSRRRLMICWWDREVSIWALGKTADEKENLEPLVGQRRKLVAKIALQSDESVAAVASTVDGTLLAVSTMAETKLFHLRPNLDLLKVRKLEIPPSVAKKGAKVVSFSPDARWLLTVSPDDNITMYRLIEKERPKSSTQVLEKSVTLRRLSREISTTIPQDGSLGNYTRSIRSVAFSSDSRILAVADNLGYLDTWVLEGYEDLTQGVNGETNGHGSDSSSDDSDESDEDEEKDPLIIMGQHWIRNPAASLLPKLPSTPLVLSFRPSTTLASPLLTDGNTAIHPTRHNPHPHSHDLPIDEDRLLVVTSENQMYEFNILSGKLSNWSRRNPPRSLPGKFREFRDPAKGIIWDMKGQNERIWLYGVNWLWMFDLSQDLSTEELQKGVSEDHGHGATGLKRKREAEGVYLNPRNDIGAGSKILDSELRTGVGRRVRRINGAKADDEKWIDLDREREAATDDEDDYVSSHASALVSLRRDEKDDGDEQAIADGQTSSKDVTSVMKRATGRPPYWHTTKYRPILGIVPLDDRIDDGSGQEEDGITGCGIEVALVERPLWDVELPPGYHGNQEWNP